MHRITLAALTVAALAGHAQAAQDYDRSIDRAAAAIVAEKIGELRGSFEAGEKPRMTPAVDRTSTGSVRHGWVDGLAPAADIRFVVPRAL